MVTRMKKLYEGKAKIIYAKSASQVVATYKDDATAFNNLKKGLDPTDIIAYPMD